MLRLDFQKGKTLVTLGDFPTTRPRKLRRACKGLRRALGVAPDVIIEVIVRKAGDLTPVALADSATINRGDMVGVRPDGKVAPWPLSHAVGRGTAVAPPDYLRNPDPGLDEAKAETTRLAEQIHETAAPVLLRTYGELSKFVRDFTGPTSAVPAGATVKDLIRQLDASSYAAVSAAIHKTGFSLSAKVDFFVAHLEESPAKAIPDRATP